MLHRRFSQNNLRKKQAQGQISIEYVIVIALVALALAGIIYYFTKGRNESLVNSESSALTSMIGAAQKLYNGNANGYNGITAAILIQNGAVPDSEVNGTSIVSGFGTPVTVAAATLYNTDDAVEFSYNVPPANCSAFVQSMQSNAAKIEVAGTAVKDVTAGTTSVDPTTLGTDCSGTGGAQVPINFYATR